MRHSTPRTLGILVSIAAVLLTVAHAAATENDPGLARALAKQQALAKDRGTDPVAWNDLGNLLMLADEPREAEASYRRAIELDPGHASARFNLALLLLQRDEDREAREQLEAVLRKEPEHAWAHYQLGALAEEQNERAEAIDHYARAFALDQGLSFAENNPHVIDNELMTESLLGAQRYMRSRSIRQVPRQYGETGRIRELILGTREQDAEEPMADEESEGAISVDAPQGGRLDGRFDAPTVAIPGDGDDRVDERASGGRVLSSDDLDPSSRTGEVLGRGAATTSRGPGSVFNRYRPPQTARPPSRTGGRPGTATGESVPPTARGGVAVVPQRGGTAADRQSDAERTRVERFRPSRRSSAQLDLILEPVAPAAAS